MLINFVTRLDTHMRTLFLLVHTSTFNISLRALTLIQQITTSFPSNSPIVSRYYRALYAILLDSRLHATRNQALFLNLLFKSLKGDPEQARVMAFVKRFCQVLVSGFGGSEFVAGGLWLLGEVCCPCPTFARRTTHAETPAIRRVPKFAHTHR
jgi:ribosome biogenesis protein MAK21